MARRIARCSRLVVGLLKTVGISLCVFAFSALVAGVPANGQCRQPATPPASSTTGDRQVDFLIALCQREDSNGASKNQFGNLGMFQMGEMALADARFYVREPSAVGNTWHGQFTDRAKFVHVTSVDSFLDSAGAQELAVRAYHQAQWQYIINLGLSTYVGSIISGIKLTKSGMIAASHLVGVSKLKAFIESHGTEVPEDGNHVPVTEYLTRFAEYF
jgi:hypothetical protein